ncbi:type I-C CRISPR-associated protein Cas5c [Lacticaseibacillus daqingensis]|uniref:type I-C CRISPR-associated protein Cas5c n=1 Tax=Lacticaseibacillus daqingensis TaxID=2486014 RepID=UPI000F77FA80|nr:type I-C CRISPR-associated protein Cas5c [Lacticaseibacillus daqingensis]
MSSENVLTFQVWGPNALFTSALTKGTERMSLPIPTYQSLIGIVESVYWKPTIVYVIDEVRVMREIRIESKGIRPIQLDGSPDLAYYSYLKDPCYQVRAHIEWNMQRHDLRQDRNMKKHIAVFNRALARGGRRDIYLGTRECAAYVRPIHFGEHEGFYDHREESIRYFGTMVHGFNYPSETGHNEFSVRLWNPSMVNGIIKFPRPEAVEDVQLIRLVDPPMQPRPIEQPVDTLFHELLGGD